MLMVAVRSQLMAFPFLGWSSVLGQLLGRSCNKVYTFYAGLALIIDKIVT